MGEVSVVATAGLTVGLVWLVSCLANKLESLPIDFAVAGLSLILLFFDLANHEMRSGGSFGGLNPVWVIGFVVGITVFLSAFTIAIFKSAQGEPPSNIFSDYGISRNHFQEFGYWISLVLAVSFLLFAVSAASNTNELLRIDLEARGGIGVFWYHVTSQMGAGSLAFLTFFLVLTMSLRYFVFPRREKRVDLKEASNGK